jgi:hypothetical protein
MLLHCLFSSRQHEPHSATIVVGYEPARLSINIASDSTALTCSPRLELPPVAKWPYHPCILQNMLDDLYLQTATGANDQPSGILSAIPTALEISACLMGAQRPSRTGANHLGPIGSRCVKEIYQNTSHPTEYEPVSIFGWIPDSIVHPNVNNGPRIHREDKSWLVFETHAPNICSLARQTDSNGAFTPREMAGTEFIIEPSFSRLRINSDY